jgi:hypothetical protein
MEHSVFKFASCLISILALEFVPLSALAQPVMEPGEERTFKSVDGGDVDCRRGADGGIRDRCTNLRFAGTNVKPDVPSSHVRISLLGNVVSPPLGIPQYATSFLFKDISISGPPDNFVPVQISLTADLENFFIMAGAYKVQTEVSVRVRDLTERMDVTRVGKISPLFANVR